VVPPLRERREALDALAAHFVEHYNRLFGKQIEAISHRALTALRAYEWPGNVREFAHAVQSAVMFTDNNRIDLNGLPEHIAHAEGDEKCDANVESIGCVTPVGEESAAVAMQVDTP
jgi:transcriptional regulator with PAS, ATPase and Fis domain